MYLFFRHFAVLFSLKSLERIFSSESGCRNVSEVFLGPETFSGNESLSRHSAVKNLLCQRQAYLSLRICLYVLRKGISPTVFIVGMGCLDQQSYSIGKCLDVLGFLIIFLGGMGCHLMTDLM